MSYQRPMLIREPVLWWPVILIAGLMTALLVLVTAVAMHLTLIKPSASPAAPQRLEGALRQEMPEFEQMRELILLEQIRASDAPRPHSSGGVEVSATVRNNTNRTISGLEVRGAVLDSQMTPMRERTIVIVPARQTAVEPGEAIGVRILLEDVDPKARRWRPLMEVTAVRFN